ncbi:MAG: flagellar biosynthesis anti-sigma factor FlgM [Actinobacteria bacterium]|nr:flagellar biosynthesis anti-sigma factor FlgM [Actinomycetota bacterium]
MTPQAPRSGPGREERSALLESLRRRIERDEYRIPAEAVADAVLAAWRRHPPAAPGGRG